ncbi:MAG: hypothetical protein J6W86_01010 [Bacteroidales bacterium]|nr:hypothetical protein [Bacteroidales bacterium]
MKTVKLIAVSSLLLVGALCAKAQDFATGYFLGGYQYAYRMNPAFPSEHNFFSVGLGQFGANIQSDFGFSDFVKKNAAGQYVLFLNNEITTDEFMSGINQGLNKFEMSTNVNLITRGHWDKEKNAMKTFDVAIKSTSRLDLPYDLFYFLKDNGATKKNLDFSGTGLTSRNYLELAYGITKIVKNKFNYGFRIKGLIGLANASMKMDNLTVDMSSSTWQINAKGTMSGSVPFATIGVDGDGYYDYSKFAFDASKITKNLGIGVAGDFGVSINLFPWFTISGAILDVGVVNWVDEISGSVSNASTFDSTKAADEDQFNQFLKSLQGIYKFKADPTPANAKIAGGKWEKLPYRVNAGAELRVPFFQRLSVGALYTMYNGDFSFNTNDLLLSLNFTPLNFLSVSASSKLGNFAKSFGGAINIHPGLFNLFAGVDVIPTKLLNIGGLFENIPEAVKPYVLVPQDDLNLNAYVGLSFALGKRQIDYRKMSKQIIKDQKEKAEAKAAEKKEKEEQKAKEKELKEYEKIKAEEAKAAEQKAKEDAKAAKIAEKEAAAQAKADEKAAKEAKAAEAKATKEAAEKAKAEAKAAKEAEKAAKAQEKAAKAAEKAAAKNAEVEAATAKMEAEKAAKAEAEAAAAAAAEEAAKTEATAAEQLLESVLEPKAEEPAAPEAPATEAPAAEAPAEQPAAEPAAPAVFEFPNL